MNRRGSLRRGFGFEFNNPRADPIGCGRHHSLAPGARASDTEHWWLLPHAFPPAGASLDLEKLAAQVDRDARPH